MAHGIPARTTPDHRPAGARLAIASPCHCATSNGPPTRGKATQSSQAPARTVCASLPSRNALGRIPIAIATDSGIPSPQPTSLDRHPAHLVTRPSPSARQCGTIFKCVHGPRSSKERAPVRVRVAQGLPVRTTPDHRPAGARLAIASLCHCATGSRPPTRGKATQSSQAPACTVRVRLPHH